MNEFSLVGRILGSLFYRDPKEPILEPLLSLIKSGKLKQEWPFEQDELIERLQKSLDLALIEQDYQSLFGADDHAVSPYCSTYCSVSEDDYRQFLQQINMPFQHERADHFALMLLAISWIEDKVADENRDEWQLELFERYLLPCCESFLGKVEAHAKTDFYRTLARITREILPVMYDELIV